jgi:mannose/fructose-specific phosphotransferase system component IIA
MLGIVICHKSMAASLVQTVKGILGYHDDLVPFTNEKITTEEAVFQLQQIIKEKGDPPEVILMADMRGGNCWAIASLISRNKSGYHVISGVNLPMVLSFLTKKDQLTAEELAETIEKDGLRGIVLERKPESD